MKAEYNLLLIFLKKGANTCPATQDAQQNLQERVGKLLEFFYNDDLRLSNRNSDAFASPSRREGSELIIILHCQTSKHPPEDSGPQPFWDTTSYTIRTLAAKSFDIAFSFSYDLH